MEQNKKAFPFSHIIGFIFSLVLTFGAALIALKTDLSANAIMWIIGTLAFLQAGIQLFMFMHLREGEDGISNIVNIVYAVFMAIIIVAGSVWVMSSGHMQHTNDAMHEEQMNHMD